MFLFVTDIVVIAGEGRRSGGMRVHGGRRCDAGEAGLCAEKLNFFFLFVDFFVMLIAEEIRNRGFQSFARGEDLGKERRTFLARGICARSRDLTA